MSKDRMIFTRRGVITEQTYGHVEQVNSEHITYPTQNELFVQKNITSGDLLSQQDASDIQTARDIAATDPLGAHELMAKVAGKTIWQGAHVKTSGMARIETSTKDTPTGFRSKWRIQVKGVEGNNSAMVASSAQPKSVDTFNRSHAYETAVAKTTTIEDSHPDGIVAGFVSRLFHLGNRNENYNLAGRGRAYIESLNEQEQETAGIQGELLGAAAEAYKESHKWEVMRAEADVREEAKRLEWEGCTYDHLPDI